MYKYIGILTDFGLRDPYVGIMKSVILKMNPDVKIIDISHEIPSFSINTAAYILLSVLDYFPKNTIFLVVVDPGVGSKRRAIVVKTRRYLFVGPDNGVLYPAIIYDGIEHIRLIENERLFLKPTSNTFHGRDIFAPVAALLSKNIPLDVIGKSLSIRDIVKLDFNIVEIEDLYQSESLCGKVIYIDKFGNVALNVRVSNYEALPLNSEVEIKINDKIFKALTSRSFSLINRGEIALYVNSFRFLEIGVNMGNAADKLRLNIGDKICIRILRA